MTNSADRLEILARPGPERPVHRADDTIRWRRERGPVKLIVRATVLDGVGV